MDKTLLIMAAGMGSRFGGLKQIEPVGPNGEFIIDYSIYDAIKAGFTKVVFVIKEENYDIFKETIGARVEKRIKVEYAFQRMDDLPMGYKFPEREKPWGTGHAILCAKDIINGVFGVINADDYYGQDAFMKLGESLDKRANSSNDYALIAYYAKNTLSDNGAVKRGYCIENAGYLSYIKECSIERVNGVMQARPLDESEEFSIDEDGLVSMNMFGFTPDLFQYLENDFVDFLETNKDNINACEYLIPEILGDNINKNNIKLEVIRTTSVWQGITYKEDKELIVKELIKYIEEGIYPKDLWS